MVVGGRIPLVFARVYDSENAGRADFGPGWQLAAAETITMAGEKATLTTESGSTLEFVEAGNKKFRLEQEHPTDYAGLARIDANTIQASLRTGFTKEFKRIDDLFRLTRIADSNGNELRLSYQGGLLVRLEDNAHFIVIRRNKSGRVTQIQDDALRSVSYSYDEAGHLIETVDLGGNHWHYSYWDDGRLNKATDPLQRLNFGVVFDDKGKVRWLQLPAGSIQFTFDPSARATTVVDRKRLTSHFFQNQDGITTRVINALGEETSIGLDGNRNVTALLRDGVAVETMRYDAGHGLLSRHTITNSGAVDRQYIYGDKGLLTRIEIANKEPQVFTYDKRGNPVLASLPDGDHGFAFANNGDLTSFSLQEAKLVFTTSSEGQIASMQRDGGAATSFAYAPGGELSEMATPGAARIKYEYQPSGLRAKMVYSDGRRVEYEYDAAGNLLSTKVFNAKGQQINGQKLEMNEAYQLVRWTLFDGTETNFRYDPNGNLTELKKGAEVTQFEYDGLDRLTAVVTPAGERLTYSYKPGERSLIEQHEHGSIDIADLRDTGLTFAGMFNVSASRPLTAAFGTVRFSESLGAFQMANSDGSEIILPHQKVEAGLARLHLFQAGVAEKAMRSGFNIPFNSMFIPAEYRTINCCPECYFDGDEWYCPPCSGGGGPGLPDHLVVLQDGTLPVNCSNPTIARAITYEVVDIDGIGLLDPFAFTETFDSETSTCGPGISPSNCAVSLTAPFLLTDLISTGCTGFDCTITATNQRWFICGGVLGIFDQPIGSPGTLEVHPGIIFVGGTLFFLPGTPIFP